jgi:hypothetical protein
MSDVISDYQKWKQQGDDLRLKAKQAMESRFRELLSEAARIAEEYRADFGAVLKPPSPVTSFRCKPQGKKSGKSKPAAAPNKPAPEGKTNPKIEALQKTMSAALKKLEAAKAAGKPTRVLDDKIYEIEDALRLAGQGQ